jgi:hypothetical protein
VPALRPTQAVPAPPAVPAPQPAVRPAHSIPAPPVTAYPGAATVARPATQAAVSAEAVGAGAAQLSAQGIALPNTGHSGPPDLDQDHRPPDRRRRDTLSGRLARLRIGSHTATRTALAQLRVGSAGAGLILGADRQQLPVSVRFFRPEPTRISLVGGVWAGQLFTFRALALGARVAVVTTDPYAWQSFGERATGQADRVTVVAAEQPLTLTGTAHQPVLIVYDQGFVGGTAPPPLGPWQTQLTVLRQLDQSGVPALQDCDLVLIQRLASAEASVAASALRLPGPSSQFLQVMADDMVAVVGDGAERYVWFAQSDIERQYAGAPRR